MQAMNTVDVHHNFKSGISGNTVTPVRGVGIVQQVRRHINHTAP